MYASDGSSDSDWLGRQLVDRRRFFLWSFVRLLAGQD
jgi:hypothetical protein